MFIEEQHHFRDKGDFILKCVVKNRVEKAAPFQVFKDAEEQPRGFLGTHIDRKFLAFFRSLHEDGRTEAHERLREVDDFLSLLVDGDGCGRQVSRL